MNTGFFPFQPRCLWEGGGHRDNLCLQDPPYIFIINKLKNSREVFSHSSLVHVCVHVHTQTLNGT